MFEPMVRSAYMFSGRNWARRWVVFASSLALLLSGVFSSAETKSGDKPGDLRLEINKRVPMRDGVSLSADVYRPASSGKFPALLMRTYWGKHESGKIKMALYFVKRGYAVVLEDVRGRF